MKQVKVIDKNKVLHKKKKVAAYARVSSDKDAKLAFTTNSFNKMMNGNLLVCFLMKQRQVQKKIGQAFKHYCKRVERRKLTLL